ncbi:uncharacterized protein N7469_003125 [Penicillium citrinum]|uniref:Uncharacterized protein n=1 Tax=Penicillium citrinum TaxID=5077 RepID=A0A9W9PBL8_PENCI|nr:uncharacterized protein N7469_003125 [Penicillium citrinum]KAJ5241534.1 hypothetical protein N7469_003125 [Penicillium citrinum]
MIIGQVTPPLAMRAELDLEDASTSGAAEYLSVKGPNVAHRWLVRDDGLPSGEFKAMVAQVALLHVTNTAAPHTKVLFTQLHRGLAHA